MKAFFNPQSVAVIGASSKKGKIGHILVENLIQNKQVKIYPINIKGHKIAGRKSFSSVLDIAEPIDLAVIAIPAKFVLSAVQECAWRDEPIKNIIIISAGFSESGEAGRKREQRLKKLIKKYQLKILGPNCLGTINFNQKLNISFAKNKISQGDIGLIMQSGAMVTALLDRASDEGLGFSLIATLGNKAGIGENELIEYYLQDKNTKIIALYLENIKDGENFKEILAKAEGKKPIVVIKAGRSQRVRKAIQSHTGALAGEVEVLKEVLQQTGAYYVESVRDLMSLLKILDYSRLPRGNKLAIITNAGGPGVIATDLVEETTGIELVELDEITKRRLKKVLPKEASIANPIDILGDALTDRYKEAIKLVSQDKKVGAILVLVTPQFLTPLNEISQTIVEANKKNKLPIYPVMISEKNEKINSIFREGNLSNFVYPEEIIKSLGKYFNYNQANIKGVYSNNGLIAKQRDIIVQKKAENILRKYQDKEEAVLFYQDAAELGSLYQLNILPGRYWEAKEIKKIEEYPVAIKVDSQKILHKKAQGGVALNIAGQKELETTITRLKKDFPQERLLIQPMIKSGLELIIGLKRDERFGMILLLGLGGVATEILNQKMIFMLPTTKVIIKEKIERSVIAKVLKKENIDIEQVIKEVEKMAVLGGELDSLKEVDLNPIVFYEDQDPIIVDIKVLLQ